AETPDSPTPAVEVPIESAEWSGMSATTAEAAQAVAQSEDRLLRLAAEYDNYRKRTNREKTEAFDRGAMALVVRLLDVVDDVDRLATSDPASTSYETFRAAFELMRRKLSKELEGAGLERIDPVGTQFDPTQHEAVAAVVPETPEQDHVVKATFQTGYRFKGDVIRPARVQVYSAYGDA
ncbi:MAG: nucleotide exchange factor GrpE, partial [Gemmatimonadales bacterium]